MAPLAPNVAPSGAAYCSNAAGAPFQPAIEVSIDPEKMEKPSRKLFLENAQILAGVASDGQFLSNTILTFGDNLGDRRLQGVLWTVSGYTNGSLSYTDIGSRLQKGVVGYYNRNYYYVLNPDNTIRTQTNYQFIGGNIFVSYPFNRYWRLEGNLGYNDRKYNGYPVWVETDEGSGIIGIPTQNSYPTIGTRLVGDTTQYESFGPISGRKVSTSALLATRRAISQSQRMARSAIGWPLVKRSMRKRVFSTRSFRDSSSTRSPA